MDEVVEADVKTWGNSLGVIIPAAIAKAHGLRAGMHIKMRLEVELPRNDPDRLPVWSLGGNYDIDKILEEDLGRDEEG